MATPDACVKSEEANLTLERGVQWGHPVRRRKPHFAIVCLLLIIYLGYLGFAHWPLRRGTNCNKARQPSHGHDGTYLNFTRRELLQLNVDVPPYYIIGESVSIAESLNICSYSWNASGNLKLRRGDPEQSHNFMVGVSMSASSQMALDSVIWPMHEDGRSVFIRCVEFPATNNDKPYWDASVQVDVTVFIKPHSLQFGRFDVNVGSLDIEVEKGLEYESYYMSLFSRQGDILGSETDAFTAHDIRVATLNGSIRGTWSLPGSIALSTGGWRTLDKPIDINLIPKRWSAGPSTGGTVSATTQGGDITIRMPLAENSLSLRNTSIDIHSQSGSISGSLVTGIRTSLTTGGSGTINATLLPYFALPDTSFIFSSTTAGDTHVQVLPAVIDSYYKIDPLSNTKSEHSATMGNVDLQYPREWEGVALGLSETGDVSILGSYFNSITRLEHLVVARTNDVIASRLDFSTWSGAGKLVME